MNQREAEEDIEEVAEAEVAVEEAMKVMIDHTPIRDQEEAEVM